MKKVIIPTIIFLIILFLNLNLSLSQNSSNSSTISNETSNQTNKTSTKPIEIIGFIPKTFAIGDSQFNIRIQNNNNFTLNNIIAIISGKGFSTYDIIPIETLAPGERDYIIVIGNFKESGNITLAIKIDKEIFYQDILVTNPNEKELEEKARQEQEKINSLNEIFSQLINLKQKYSELEAEYYEKKDKDYELSKINLEELKKYLREVEIDVLNEDIKNAKANLVIANETYFDQKKKLDNSKPKSAIMKLKDNAFIFSTIAGALITFFALYELLRRKSENVVGTIKQVHGKIRKPEKKNKKK